MYLYPENENKNDSIVDDDDDVNHRLLQKKNKLMNFQ